MRSRDELEVAIADVEFDIDGMQGELWEREDELLKLQEELNSLDGDGEVDEGGEE